MRSKASWILLPICLLLIATQVFGGLGRELIVNGGFELDENGDGIPDGWHMEAKNFHRYEHPPLSGNYVIDAKPKAYVIAIQPLELEPGKKYTFKVRCRSGETGRGAALLLHGETKPETEMPLVWNLEPGNEFTVFSNTFTAPNKIAHLYIYDLSQTGHMSYDYVSLREGEPDGIAVTQFNLRKIDQPYGKVPTHAQVKTGSPLEDGGFRTLFFIRQLAQLREVEELAQRIDLRHDVVQSSGKEGELVSFTGSAANEAIEKGSISAYVVASKSTEGMRSWIMRDVRERGVGLVLLEHSRCSASEWGLGELSELASVRDVYPFANHPEGGIMRGVRGATVGKGRVVVLSFDLATSEMHGILPFSRDVEVWRHRQHEHWEGWMSLLSESIRWAVRGESGIKVELSDVDGVQVELRVTGAGASQVRLVYRSLRETRFDGRGLYRTEPARLSLTDDGIVSFARPGGDFPVGDALLDVAVEDAEGHVLCWKTLLVKETTHAKLSRLKTGKTWYDASENVEAQVNLELDGASKALLEARLIDAFGRVISTQQIEAATDGDFAFTRLPLANAGNGFVRVEVCAYVDGCEHSREWTAVTLPKMMRQQAEDDFGVLAWRPMNCHPQLSTSYTNAMRELGQNVDFCGDGYTLTENGMPAAGYIERLGEFYDMGHNEKGIRPHCPSNPEVRKQIVEKVRKSAENQKPYGFLGVGLADEGVLANDRRITEFCRCEHCLAGYRKWLRERYFSLENLNAQWESTWDDWDKITPVLSADIRKRENFGEFIDFRTYMTDVWIGACRLASDTYHAVDPEARIGMTNTFGASPFGGNDYWKYATKAGFGWMQEYSEAFKNSGFTALFEIWRSFTGRNFLNYGWIGYWHRNECAAYEPWWLALHGSRGVSYFSTNSFDAERQTSWALIHADQSRTAFGTAVANSIKDLRRGVGKLLMDYERLEPTVGILWSYPSMLVSWCESQATQPVPQEGVDADNYGSFFRTAFDFRHHIDDLQLDSQHIAVEQLMGNYRLIDRQRLLYLPFACAINKDLVPVLLEFVKAGGVLVGDLRMGVTDEHGKRHAVEGSPLETLFGVRRNPKADPIYGETVVTMDEIGEIKAIGREKLEARGAKPLGRHADKTPAIFMRNLGEGRTVYLNFRLPALDAKNMAPGSRKLVSWLVELANLGSLATITAKDTDAFAKAYELNAFHRDGYILYGFIRDYRRCPEAEATNEVSLNLRFRSHLYDVRKGEYLGRFSRTTMCLKPGETILYAGLPSKIDSLEMETAETNPGVLRIVARAVTEDGGSPLGHHVFNVVLRNPSGHTLPCHVLNLAAPRGSLDTEIHLGLNRQPGQWTVGVKDVITGLTSVTTVNLP